MIILVLLITYSTLEVWTQLTVSSLLLAAAKLYIMLQSVTVRGLRTVSGYAHVLEVAVFADRHTIFGR